MKKISLYLLSVSSGLLLAQAPPPSLFSEPAATKTPAPAKSNPVQSSQVTVSPPPLMDVKAFDDFSNKAFDVENDSIDFEEGTFNWKGRSFNIGNSRVARARFERYLATPRISDNDEIYLGILEKISEMLSLAGEQDMKDAHQLNEEVFNAWKLLFVAGRYELDGGTSLVIANQVYNIWRIRDENLNTSRAQVLMAEERQRLERELSSNSWVDKQEFNEVQKQTAKGHHTGEMWDGVTDATFAAERLAELKGRIALMETQGEMNGLQAKLQFQSQIVNLLLSRRYEHCLIACHFYRYAFRGSHQQLQVGLEQLKSFIPISDFSPTVETVELLAREAITDVHTGLMTVNSLYENNELYSALERLQETYFLGEYQLDVLQYPPDRKKRLLAIYRNVNELQNLLELKDYAEVETVVDRTKELAYDFPASQILSGVRSAQRLSNLSLMAAQQAVGLGDFEKAETALARATQIWPLNPAVKNYTADMASKADVSSQATFLFDEALARKDYRAIFDRRTEFGAALMRDPDRSAILKETVERIGNVEILISQAEEMSAQNNAFTAWEMLLRAAEIEPGDPQLARAQARLAPRVASFVGELDAANRAEEHGNFAVALNRYLAAQDIYPASKTSLEGIERVGKRLLTQIAQKQESEEQ